MIHWSEHGEDRSAPWRSESGASAPRRVVLADDTLAADAAYRLVCEGTGLLWRGDFQNARELLDALRRRIDRPRTSGKGGKGRTASAAPAEFPHAFHLHRQAQAQRARLLGLLLVELQPDWGMALRRAPDWRAACAEAWGPPPGTPCVVSLRELLGAVGAHEWRKKGVPVPALGASIHPHYGVFSPVRGEYVDLVAQAPLPPGAEALAFEIGTGTGVLAAVLARRGVARVVATEVDPRAIACARDNLARLALAGRVELLQADLFPEGRAPLIVCNPPWLPAKAAAPIERAVYDEGSRMLRNVLAGLAAHLAPQGEGWLILSDLAEHLRLRSRDELLAWVAAAGLEVRGRHDIRPRHGKATAGGDALAAARAAEVTSLWRLGVRAVGP